MGSYCKFCGRRCFVLRTLADNETLCLATCPRGMAHDMAVVGQNHTSAHNPYANEVPCQPDCPRCQVQVAQNQPRNAGP